MPTTLNLTYREGWFGNPYYRNQLTGSAYICAKGLRRYVDIPLGVDCRVRATKTDPNNGGSFHIMPSGKLQDVGVELTQNFYLWLSTRWNKGDRYVYFDYLED